MLHMLRVPPNYNRAHDDVVIGSADREEPANTRPMMPVVLGDVRVGFAKCERHDHHNSLHSRGKRSNRRVTRVAHSRTLCAVSGSSMRHAPRSVKLSFCMA